MTLMNLKRILSACALVLAATGANGGESAGAHTDGAAELQGASSHALMAKLQRFVQDQGVDLAQLNADAMVRLMIEWYRFTPLQGRTGETADDALVYRYGGWSEGCATAFKLSLLRRVTEQTGTQTSERVAGITLMFEPSNQADLVPFTAVSSEVNSIEAFLRTIESSPAFKQLAGATPMGVLIETGGMR